MKVSPSLLAADFYNLEKELARVASSNVDFLHLDVMDGEFVPNISFGPGIIKNLRSHSNLFFDTHLMIANPRKYISSFKDAGSNLITWHLEINEDHHDLIKQVHNLNMLAGLSIKPLTNVKDLIPYLTEVDLILVMSVEPGFGGQKFIPSAIDKIKFLDDYRKKNNLHYQIEVDGGINLETAKLVKDAGCDIVVAGTYLFKGNMQELVKELKSL